MICPLSEGSDVGTVCQNRKCPFNSLVEDNGCYHGRGHNNSLKAIAQHRGVKTSDIEEYTDRVEAMSTRWIAIHSYARFCDSRFTTVNEKDKKLWESLSQRKPYNTPMFRFIDLQLFARMRRKEAYAAFSVLASEYTEGLSLKRFLTCKGLDI